jgi:hypothetical protein
VESGAGDSGWVSCAVAASSDAKATEQNHRDAGKLLILAAPTRAAILVTTAQATRNYW